LGRPYLRKSKGEATFENKFPYLAIPAIFLSLLVLLYEIGYYYLLEESGPYATSPILAALMVFIFCSALSTYFSVILPRVFYFSVEKLSFVRPLSPLRTVLFVLPALLVPGGFLWFLSAAFFDACLVTFDQFLEHYRFLEMEASFSWLSLPACLVILWLLNRVFLRPYLIRTKGMVSRDDQLPYFVILTLIVVFLVFVFDIYRYNLGAIQIEQLRFSFTLFFCSSAILFCLGFLLPRVFYFRYQEIAFAKNLSDKKLVFCYMSTSMLITLFVVYGFVVF